MCTNGVNVDQFKMMLEQMDDQVALNRRWTHKLFHKADDNGYENTAAVLKEIQGSWTKLAHSLPMRRMLSIKMPALHQALPSISFSSKQRRSV